MQNLNQILLQNLLNNLQLQEVQPELNVGNKLAYAPMTPQQQAWANKLPRRDITLQDTNLNYIPTMEQIGKMNILNARGLTTDDREQMRSAREAYDEILKRYQGK